jgi:hypothetical protein
MPPAAFRPLGKKCTAIHNSTGSDTRESGSRKPGVHAMKRKKRDMHCVSLFSLSTGLQKVSDKLEVTKAIPRLVADNQ